MFMAKKSLGEEMKDAVLEVIKGHFLSRMKDHADEIIDKMHDTVVITQQKLIRGITAVALFIFGLVLVIMGSIYLLIDYYRYTRSSVFLVTGFIVILVSVILAESARLLKRHLRRE